MHFSLEADSTDPVKVSVSGKIVQASFQPDVEPIQQLVGDDVYAKRLTLDMRGVDFLDSSGVGWLLKCHRRFRDSGGRLVLHSLPPNVANVLRVLHMDKVLCVVSSETAAIKLLAEEGSQI